MPVQITAKRNGFRRCGIAHSEKTTTWPDDHFSAEQLRELENEAQLVVVRVSDKAVRDDDSGAELAETLQKVKDLQLQLQEKDAAAEKLEAFIADLQEQSQVKLDALMTQITEKDAALLQSESECSALRQQLAEPEQKAAEPEPASDGEKAEQNTGKAKKK
ncbi:hypothetical protein EHW64_13615 [Erwinia psidii]|uniref:HI1506-related protein n=1 Tax=Erwinia psidii TaxID=69224 RepID=UPI00226B637B|nr:HI1506-related protein [Erwinia psidii]MCX8962140.1 hypothetical protein [Erwinia psidii]